MLLLSYNNKIECTFLNFAISVFFKPEDWEILKGKKDCVKYC